MTNNNLTWRGRGKELHTPTRKECSVFVAFLAIVTTVIAGLGDWKVLNGMYGGLPKAVALGTILCAFMSFLVDADFGRLRKAMSYFPVFLLLIVVYTLISMSIWITDLSQVTSISRAGQKIAYQTITIVYAVSMCYLFEERAVNRFFLGMCLTNAAIMLLEMPKYGVKESITSIVTCIVTFGEAKGFMRALEIHDITFLFGQFFIYYMMFAPKGTAEERRIRRLGIFFSMFFLLVGLKRTTIPAMILVCLAVKLARLSPRKLQKLIMATGIGLFLFLYVYLYLTRSGLLMRFFQMLGVDMMGRDVLWSLPNEYYELSPLWKGLGFEGVSELVSMWVRDGLLNKSFPLHNDILKIFIELGALGFTLWAGINYILYPAYWILQHDTENGLLYLAILTYMTVTYMTDNTAFYFWCSVGLRLIPMSFSYRFMTPENPKRWKAPTRKEIADEIWLIEMGGEGENAE